MDINDWLLPSTALRPASRLATRKASASSRGTVCRPSTLTRMEWPSCSSRGSCQGSTETATSAHGTYQTPNQNTDTVCISCRKTFTELQVAWISATATTTWQWRHTGNYPSTFVEGTLTHKVIDGASWVPLSACTPLVSSITVSWIISYTSADLHTLAHLVVSTGLVWLARPTHLIVGHLDRASGVWGEWSS